MSATGYQSSESFEKRPEVTNLVAELFPGYRPTDMQYNIGRIEGIPAYGLDLISPASRERMLLTPASSKESEAIIKAALGNDVMPARIEGVIPADRGFDLFWISVGSRPVIKTLRAAPYATEYMGKMSYRVGAFLRQLSELDPGAFGVSIEQLAIGHEAENDDDDAMIMVVPPLLAPGVAPPIDTDALRVQMSRTLRFDLTKAFMQGLTTPAEPTAGV